MARSLMLSLSNAVWYEALILWTELKMPIAVNKVSTRLAFLMRSRNIIFYNNFFDSTKCVKTYAYLSQVENFRLGMKRSRNSKIAPLLSQMRLFSNFDFIDPLGPYNIKRDDIGSRNFKFRASVNLGDTATLTLYRGPRA